MIEEVYSPKRKYLMITHKMIKYYNHKTRLLNQFMFPSFSLCKLANKNHINLNL